MVFKRTKNALAADGRGGRSPQNQMLEAIAQGRAVRQRNSYDQQANKQAAQLAKRLRAKGKTCW